MSARKFVFNESTDAAALLRFMRQVNPKGGVIHFDGGAEVWLLKPTEKGGPTIGRVIVHGEAASIKAENVWKTYWNPSGRE